MATVTTNTRELDAFYNDVAIQYFDEIDPIVQARFRSEVPVDTGLLRSRHRRLKVIRDRGRWVGRWVAPTGYDLFVHDGTGERAKASAGPQTIKRLNARVVMRVHPGQRANPWLYRSLVRLGFPGAVWIKSR
jgi:hypothetical protein